MIILSRNRAAYLTLNPVLGERLDIEGRAYFVAGYRHYSREWILARNPAGAALLEFVDYLKRAETETLGFLLFDLGIGYCEPFVVMRWRHLFRAKPLNV